MTAVLVGPVLAGTVLVGLALAPWAWRGRHPAGAPARSRWRPGRPDRHRAAAPVRLDPALVAALLETAVRAGASVPGALRAVGRAVGADTGDALVRAGTLLELGSSWSQAWSGVGLDPVAEALDAAWTVGAAPGPALRLAGEQWTRRRRAAARGAAGALGVALVLPLGLCFLPAFVLLGLVPVVVSLAGTLLR